jgi:glycosyltransferase involved in cell wall biosynthesis
MLTQFIGIGGLERMILNLSIELKASGKWAPEVFVFDHPKESTKDENLLSSFEEQKIPVEVFSKGRGFSFEAARLVARRCRENGIGTIHSHDLGALIYAVIAKYLLFGRVRIVHTQHSFVHLSGKKRIAHYERIFTRFVEELTVVSEECAEIYERLGVPRARIKIVTNGVSFPSNPVPDRKARVAARLELAKGAVRAHQISGQMAESTWVLCMARLHSRKGQDHAVKLWESLSPERRKTTIFAFVGAETLKGQLAKLENLIASAPDRGRLIYFGSTRDPQAWLKSADIFLSCSEFEGMPLGPLEAAGAGIPFLLSDISGHAMLKDYGPTYPLDKPDLGALFLDELCAELERDDEHGLRVRLWQRALPIRSIYSIAAMAQRYETLYD